MPGLITPNPFSIVDGLTVFSVVLPNNSVARANLRGALYELSRAANYDPDTGDTDMAAETGRLTYRSLHMLTIANVIPMQFYGVKILKAEGNYYHCQTQTLAMQGYGNATIRINNNNFGYVDGNIPVVSLYPYDYDGNVITIYERDNSTIISQSLTQLNDYCAANMGQISLYHPTKDFGFLLEVKEWC